MASAPTMDEVLLNTLEEPNPSQDMELETGTRKRTARTDDTDEEQGNDWNVAQSRKARRTARKELTEITTTPTAPKKNFNKFKVIAGNSNEAYKKVAYLNEKHPGLKLSAKPNLKSEWIITPHDEAAHRALTTTSTISLQELKREEKTKKAILTGFPFDIPNAELCKHPQIMHAERMKTRDGHITKTMLCTFTGQIPEKAVSYTHLTLPTKA